MKAEVINQILASTTTVLTDYFNIKLEQNGAPSRVSGAEALAPVTVVLGITGDLEGQFMLGYETATAIGIAGKMLGSDDYSELDDMGKSALSELGNMIGGMTSTRLSDMGYFCNLSPPSLIIATSGTITMSSALMISLPITSSVGKFNVCIGLRDANSD